MNDAPPRRISFFPYTALAAVCLAPVCVGGMHPYGQALTGWLLGAGLLLDIVRPEASPQPQRQRVSLWLLLLAGFTLCQCLPLPASGVAWLHPSRAELAAGHTPPAWMSLSVSPAAAIQRCWELCLAYTIFLAFQRGAAEPQFAPRAAAALIGVVAFQCLADLGYRLGGQRALLGLWPVSWGTGAGTFANRNHFAGFLAVATLFGLAAVAQWVRPELARSQPHLTPARWRPPVAWVSAAILAAGVVCLAQTGSRGAVLALGAGGGVWIWLQARLLRSRRQRLWLSAFALLALLGLIVASGFVSARFAAGTLPGGGVQSRAFIWRESLALFQDFPWFGVGLGGFATAFNRFKSAGGEVSFLHAENEALEWLVEMGLIGTTLALLLLTGFVRTVRANLARPEFRHREWAVGAAAGLAAFAIHAGVEFVAQIPATLFLAAALAGLLASPTSQPATHPQPHTSKTPPRGNALIAVGTLLLAGVASCQAASAWLWAQALALDRSGSPPAALQSIQSSLRLWPLATDREIGRLRAEGKRLDAAPRKAWAGQLQVILAAGELSRALDPLHWELHWERLWLKLAYGSAATSDQRQIREEADFVMRLNPRQPWIPIRMARHFASRDPDYARTLLARASTESIAALRAILEIAWELDHQAAALWQYVPDQPWALEVLADYALSLGLPRMAADAYRRLHTHRPDGLKLAERLLRCGEPLAALHELATLPGGSPARWALEARALAAAGQPQAASRAFERLFADQAGVLSLAPTGSAAAPHQVIQQARQWAGDPSSRRALADLEALAERYPSDPRLQLLLFQAWLSRGESSRAANVGARIASTWLR